MVEQAQSICTKFKDAFTFYAGCHTIFNSSNITEDGITRLGKYQISGIQILSNPITHSSQYCTCHSPDQNIMAYYRRHFPQASILPKMHMLEEHVVPFFNKWKAGFGMMAEQGAESIHARFNPIGTSYRSMVHSKVERL